MDLWLHGSSDAGACGHANQYFELSLDTASVRSRSWCVSFTAFLCAPDGKWQCSRIRDSATGSRRTVIRVRRWRAEEKSEIRGREQNGFRLPNVLFGALKAVQPSQEVPRDAAFIPHDTCAQRVR